MTCEFEQTGLRISRHLFIAVLLCLPPPPPQVAALTSGRSEVSKYDCLLLKHVLASTHHQQVRPPSPSPQARGLASFFPTDSAASS